MTKKHPYKGRANECTSFRRRQSQVSQRRRIAGPWTRKNRGCGDEDEDGDESARMHQMAEGQSNYKSNSEPEITDYGNSDSE